MGKRSPSPPPAPDPVKTAQAQGAANKEAAIAQQELAMVNQQTPWGQLTYNQTGTSSQGTPQYTATQTLSPEQQQMLNLSNQAGINYGTIGNQQLQALQGTLSQPFDLSSLGAAPTRDATRDALLQRMQPQMEQDRNNLEARLAAQGIGMGSGAYSDAMNTYNRSVNDARLAADIQAGNAMVQDIAARQQQISEMLMPRQQGINEVAALMSGSQVQSPQFVNTPQPSVAPADIMGATYGSYQGNLNAANQAQSGQNAMMGGLFGLGSSLGLAYLMSDRRLKTGIVKLGELANGLGVYMYRYIWGGPVQVGVMADEVKKIIPEAVKRFGEYDAVDYSRIV